MKLHSNVGTIACLEPRGIPAGRRVWRSLISFAVVIVVAGLVLAKGSPALAVAFTWQNTLGGDWTVDGNWDQTGEPDDTGDTASIGDLSGAYTVTLGANRTIGGLTLSGSDPTLDLSSTLGISGGASTIDGSLLGGAGTISVLGGGTINWSGNVPGSSSLTIQVPYVNGNSPSINNAAGSFNISSGQTFQMIGADGSTGFEQTTIANGFTNDGVIRLGNEQPGSFFAHQQLVITNGTLTNNAAGQIILNPREPNNLAAPWNDRFILGNVQNNGLVTVKTPAGQLGTTGKTVGNSGTITLDSSIIAGGSSDGRALLNIIGSTFTNSTGGIVNVDDGTLNITATSFTNDGTVNVTSGTLSIITDTFALGGGLNVNGSTLAFGAHTVDTVVAWTGSDIVNPYTFRVNANAEITVNRTSTWDLLSGQTLEFQVEGGNGQTGLTLDQDMTNSGVILMGKDQPGNNFIDHRMTINSTESRLTNNSDGVIHMFPRSDSSLSAPWSDRRLQAELVNNGEFNILTHRGFLGKAGVDHVNNATITFDDAILGPTVETPTLFVTGNSLTNASGGILQGIGILNVTGTTFNNAGTISPGLSAGILEIQGAVNFQSGSELIIEVTGDGAVAGTDHDQLVINGTLTGLSSVDLVLDFSEIPAGTDFDGDILSVLTVSGTDISSASFNSISFLGTWTGDVSFQSNAVLVSNVEFFVPEPSSSVLLGLGALVVLRRGRRRFDPRRHAPRGNSMPERSASTA